jgi:hypothetical protein
MSVDYFGISFVQFGGETKCQMPWELGHSSSFSEEEDEQLQQNGVVLAQYALVR